MPAHSFRRGLMMEAINTLLANQGIFFPSGLKRHADTNSTNTHYNIQKSHAPEETVNRAEIEQGKDSGLACIQCYLNDFE